MTVAEAALKKLATNRQVGTQQAILVVLAEGENYGLGIRDRVFDKTGIRIGPGALYPALHSLEQDGLVTSRVGESNKRGGRPKVYYQITELGREVERFVRDQVEKLYGWELR